MKAELSDRTAIFDLDMTLIEYTFSPAVYRFADQLIELTGAEIDREEFRQQWQQIFEDFKRTWVVNPIVTTITAQMLIERYGLIVTSKEAKEMLIS